MYAEEMYCVVKLAIQFLLWPKLSYIEKHCLCSVCDVLRDCKCTVGDETILLGFTTMYYLVLGKSNIHTYIHIILL